MDMQLLDMSEMAAMLKMGPRTLWRFRDSGRLPAPVALGRCIRWRRGDIERWVAAGCPDVRRTGWKPEDIRG
jgi:predicted DNA-binding transcriptional regulator AlpA